MKTDGPAVSPGVSGALPRSNPVRSSPAARSDAGARQTPPTWPLVVAVPAKDEAERITRTLSALSRQVGETSQTYRIVVLVNNSRDQTAALARRVAARSPVMIEVVDVTLPPRSAHVGAARGLALSLAAERLEAHSEGILATTDADTLVAPDWARRTREALMAGADVVGGRILTLPEERAQLPAAVRRLQLQDAAYHLLASQLLSRLDGDPHDAWPRHHQHFGASLGLRLSAWRQLGEWPQVRCLEDVALVQACLRLDLRLRHCPDVRVWTSARLGGRVETGLSSQLREWQAVQGGGTDWLVPGAAELEAQGRARAALRRCWNSGPLDAREVRALEALWLVKTGELDAALEAYTFGLAHEAAQLSRQRAGRWAVAFPAVPLVRALGDLRRLLESLP